MKKYLRFITKVSDVGFSINDIVKINGTVGRVNQVGWSDVWKDIIVGLDVSRYLNSQYRDFRSSQIRAVEIIEKWDKGAK